MVFTKEVNTDSLSAPISMIAFAIDRKLSTEQPCSQLLQELWLKVWLVRVMPLLPVYVQTFHFKYIYIPLFFLTYSSTSPGCLHRQVPYCVSNRLLNFIIIQPRMSYHTEQDDVDRAGPG